MREGGKVKAFKKRGQSIVELCVGLMVLVPIVLLVFDLAVIVMAVQVNDSTCREAARVAASGNLGDLGPPKSLPLNGSDIYKRADAVVKRANTQSAGILSNFKLASVTTTPAEASIASTITSLGKTGGPVTGTVTVVTTVEVRPFLVKYAYSGGAPLVFQSGQSFPFTYVVPNTAQLTP
ncbi:MAG TPA: pilus assembly protein [Candidatus Melainabacteria bacterium]|jgi:hypothetical protein|nr:pilus assembly protein [Candidatus Melainabacteria bacterium]